MQNTDPNEFTDREKFILTYYKSPNAVSAYGLYFYDVIVVLGSLVCLVLAAVRSDSALGFVAYALLLGRLGYLVIEGSKWTRDFQSIFRKYDAKLQTLADGEKKEN